MTAPVIAIDAMGGDSGPHCIVPACLSALAAFPSLRLILVGDPSRIEPLLTDPVGTVGDRLRIHPALEIIAMDESPALALRGKPDASMRRMLELVRDGEAQAAVSAGNSGALMVLSRQVLGMLEGIDRPAMVTSVPTAAGSCLLLDLGANVDCTPQHLQQFAVMGSVLAEVQGVRAPRVALLNIGSEPNKGNQQVRQAAALLEQSCLCSLNYTGFVEGHGVYAGAADVVVCDGFAGNVLLKSSEGLASLLVERLTAVFRGGWRGRLAGLLARPLLRQLRDELHPARYNGAGLLGLRGVVVKSHGNADAEAFAAAIVRALQQVREQLPERVSRRLRELEPSADGISV